VRQYIKLQHTCTFCLQHELAYILNLEEAEFLCRSTKVKTLPRCIATYSDRTVPGFQRNMLPPFSRLQHILLKHLYVSINLHYVTSQETVTLNLHHCRSFQSHYECGMLGCDVIQFGWLVPYFGGTCCLKSSSL